MKRVILIVSFLLVCGCQNEEPMTTETAAEDAAVVDESSGTEPEPITEPTDLMISETEGPSMLESAELRVSDEERSAADGESVSVKAGETVELIVRVRQVPEGLAAWVHWMGPDDQRVSQEQKTVPEGGVVSFTADTREWVEGEYSAEIYIGGDLVDIKELSLTAE